MRNLLATVVFLFNDATARAWQNGAVGVSGVASGGTDGRLSGLPSECYFDGSVARQIAYVSPARWTVIVYVGVAGFLVAATAAGQAWSAFYRPEEASLFAAVDFLRLAEALPFDIVFVVHGVDCDTNPRADLDGPRTCLQGCQDRRRYNRYREIHFSKVATDTSGSSNIGP